MATATLLALSEYLRTSYDPDCELVDGQLKERNMGDGPHSALQRFFLKFFFGIEQTCGLLAYPELRTQTSETNCRIPDVLVVRDTDPFESVVTKPPLLCVEVLSPDDRMSEMVEKIEDYLNMGVTAVWVVDPRRRTALCADVQGTRPMDVLVVPGTDIRLAVRDAFLELDLLEARRKQ